MSESSQERSSPLKGLRLGRTKDMPLAGHPGHRHERVAEEIAHELGSMLAGELMDPRLDAAVNVSEVRMVHGLKMVRVFVSVRGDEAEDKRVLAGLNAASGFIRHELASRLRLRRAPELLFVIDRSEEYSQHIEELLREAKKLPSS
ncbi:MAG: 30S ribosome-binding factor RbfA [Candidatus Acidiferrales bacterium]